MLLYVHRNRRLIRDGEWEGRVGSGTYEWLVRALRPVKTEETVSHRQNNNLMEVGTRPERRSLCTSLTAVSAVSGLLFQQLADCCFSNLRTAVSAICGLLFQQFADCCFSS